MTDKLTPSIIPVAHTVCVCVCVMHYKIVTVTEDILLKRYNAFKIYRKCPEKQKIQS